MKLTLPHKDSQSWTRVTKIIRDVNRLHMSKANQSNLLETRIYEVRCSDGQNASISANIIAENMFAQSDDEGNRFQLISEIMNHRTDGSETQQQDVCVTTQTGTKRSCKTNNRWQILFGWKDDRRSCVRLQKLKESCPVQSTDHVMQAKTSEHPAFSW